MEAGWNVIAPRARWASTARGNGVNAIACSRGLADGLVEVGCGRPTPATTICPQAADHQSGLLDGIGQDRGIPEAGDAKIRPGLRCGSREICERPMDTDRMRRSFAAHDNAQIV